VRIPITNGTIYGFPSLTGVPVGAQAPPMQSPWGWTQPVFFLDAQGARWQLTATEVTTGHPDYWRMLDQVGTPYVLWIEAEVPTIALTPPPGGVDATPEDDPLSWFVAMDRLHRRWFVSIRGDTLQVTLTQPLGVGIDSPAVLADTLAVLWMLAVQENEAALVATTLSQFGVSTSPLDVVVVASGANGANGPTRAPVSAPAAPTVTPFTTTLPSTADYWRLFDEGGTLYALWIEGEVPTLSADFTGGIDRTPLTDTLVWVALQDDTAVTWYLSVVAQTLSLDTTMPSGTGTSTALTLQDAAGQAWALSVQAGAEAVLTTTTTAPAPPTLPPPVIPTTADYWRLVDDLGTPSALFIEAEVPTLTTAITGGHETTPGGAPLPWFVATDVTNATWYIAVQGGTLQVSTTAPAGSGSFQAATLADASGALWTLTISRDEEALIAALPLPPGPEPGPPPGVPGTADYWRLLDSTGTLYAFYIEAEVPTLTTTITGGTDRTPEGTPLTWYTVLDELGTLWYVTVRSDTFSLQVTVPMGLGTYQVPTLADSSGAVWSLTAYVTGEALVTTLGTGPDGGGALLAGTWRIGVQLVPESEQIPGLQPALDVHEAANAFRHIQAAGSLLSLLVS
jgi:hypothetical protein